MITIAMMMEPEKYGLEECKHCNGWGTSLKEGAARCTQCGGSGLVAAQKREVSNVGQ